jgi:acyl-CoA hydrolase
VLKNSFGIPELLRVDQVLFLMPVTVGSTLEIKSKITLIEEIEGVG